MRLHLEGGKALIKRYLAVWRAVWQQRHLLTSLERNSDERAFLPAALELQETPVSPLPRAAMWLIIGFVMLALVWAILGKLDVVATAQGKIVSSDRIKIIQPLETAVVKAIHVRDGEQVNANDLLLELDATAAKADEKRSNSDWIAARLAAARALAFLAAMKTEKKSYASLIAGAETNPLLAGIPKDQITGEEKILAAQMEEYTTKLKKYDAEISRNKAAITSAQETLSQLQETLPIIRERAQDYKKLFEQDYVSKHEYLDKEREKIETEHEAAAQASKLMELESALTESRRAKEGWVAETRKITQEALKQSEQQSLAIGQERIKAEQQVRSMQLRAPVAGKIQQLAIHTIGGVVTAGPAHSGHRSGQGPD